MLSPRPLPTFNKGAQNESDDDNEDYEEEMTGCIPVMDPTRADGDPYPLVDPSEAERLLETKEERAMRVFLEDPERALKTFLHFLLHR